MLQFSHQLLLCGPSLFASVAAALEVVPDSTSSKMVSITCCNVYCIYMRWHFHSIVCLMVVPRMNLCPIFFRAFKSRPAVHICDLLSLHLTFHFMTAKKQVHVIWSNSDEKEEPSESLRITHLLYNPSGKA